MRAPDVRGEGHVGEPEQAQDKEQRHESAPADVSAGGTRLALGQPRAVLHPPDDKAHHSFHFEDLAEELPQLQVPSHKGMRGVMLG